MSRSLGLYVAELGIVSAFPSPHGIWKCLVGVQSFLCVIFKSGIQAYIDCAVPDAHASMIKYNLRFYRLNNLGERLCD